MRVGPEEIEENNFEVLLQKIDNPAKIFGSIYFFLGRSVIRVLYRLPKLTHCKSCIRAIIEVCPKCLIYFLVSQPF